MAQKTWDVINGRSLIDLIDYVSKNLKFFSFVIPNGGSFYR